MALINSASGVDLTFWWVVVGAILAAVIVFVVVRIIIPKLRARQRKEFNQSDVFLMMIEEFESAVLVKNKAKARSVYSRVKHFYDYMTPQERVPFESKIKEMADKLNRMG